MATFDELAERLARAPSARERIEAAEALAKLDDERVTPTLAKALADPSAEVRQRIEQLLSHFCHRDATGHLRTLLEEAQHVSAALAAELSRLRGEAPIDDIAPTPESIEPPDGFEGDCVVVRLTAGPLDVKRACQLVAKALDRPLFEVTRELHLTKGFFTAAAPAPIARRLVGELDAAGVPAAAAPVDWLPEPLQMVRVRSPRFAADGLLGVAVPEGHQCEVTWPSVELAVAGRAEVELKRRRADEDWSLFTRPLKPRGDQAPVHEIGYEYVVELFAREPPQRLRLLTHELDFEVMQRRPSDFGSVARLARGLVRWVDRRQLAAGVRRLAELDRDAWDDLTFLSPSAFEHYVTWQRLLLHLGVPLPR